MSPGQPLSTAAGVGHPAWQRGLGKVLWYFPAVFFLSFYVFPTFNQSIEDVFDVRHEVRIPDGYSYKQPSVLSTVTGLSIVSPTVLT